MTDAQWEVFSYQSVIAAAVLYFLAMLAYFFELAGLRTVAKIVSTRASRPAMAVRRFPSSAGALRRRPASSKR